MSYRDAFTGEARNSLHLADRDPGGNRPDGDSAAGTGQLHMAVMGLLMDPLLVNPPFAPRGEA